MCGLTIPLEYRNMLEYYKDNPKVLSSGLNVIGKKLILPEGLVVERNVRIFSSPNPKEITDKHIHSGETIK